MKAQTDDSSVIPIPQRKKELVELVQPRQIIEIQEIDEGIPIPKRKKGVERKLREDIKEVKNEIRDKKNIENKDDELAVTEIINSIRDKLTECWRIPESIVYKENFSIKINLLLSSKGEIVVANVADSSSYQNNPLFRSAADNAMRAVYKCSPLIGLPAEQHHIWREVTLDFIVPNLGEKHWT
ncbi:hypothetical protein C1A_1167 [Wolbachia endosymbiont of Culex quinquefasciatus JHB]|uniref:Jg654 protein n=1 Tax=Pararge aegeria aegeria TaxID=348720 RepID=A0A8S4QKU0_9NEOP|nr:MULTISPECIES: hypothetical protein [Wolbachia]EEB55358.1 hypothetical protein C1A_1167 [Wolbachia endosymbiont of Culex quinquefasciatus JHB]CAH2210648.1 jg654 [Pararge aegeria aegeria]CQD10948.1 Uncharacterised protein [Wolbachia endosymbiont wPip_Mol of Culex molestus]